MNLSLDYHAAGAGAEQFPSGGFGFFARSRHGTARHGHTILLKNSFSLILVDFHNRSSAKNWEEPACGYRLRAANGQFYRRVKDLSKRTAGVLSGGSTSKSKPGADRRSRAEREERRIVKLISLNVARPRLVVYKG